MASPTENNASDVQPSKAKPPVAYDEFEDCFACRATGEFLKLSLDELQPPPRC
ncbi:hypothetical protein ASPSYDRAFT_866625 [Aspergillus sydowii CBS 593.65]|uniref:Uncharacterized protein n=1 Tax=Aspergillus sydowii CBS 593.65 TaxID=1036612 RepID=A0A1L9TJA6_9EURO|nr:uncharacterized protein ASPSYDRAFT_866625 [Aspergillus sydowii CBS 593.65]OJJ59461.1 hypothetical protein ASPSYDRAFT_866625 [Aspergillus sydowii CBS 593.65]